MSVSSSIRNALIPIHPEGYKFIAVFFVASVILGLALGSAVLDRSAVDSLVHLVFPRSTARNTGQ